MVNQRAFADCSFRVGTSAKRVFAHRVLLAAASPVLERMLYPDPHLAGGRASPGDTARAQVHDIVVVGVRKAEFLAMLRSIYTGDPGLTEQTVGGCIRLAKLYLLEPLLKACKEFLERGVVVQNACALFNIGPQLTGDPDLARSFVERHASLVLRTPGFRSLTKERLLYLLDSDQLRATELEIFHAVLSWAEAQSSPDALPEVLAKVRFPTLSLDVLGTAVQSANVLSSEELLECYVSASVSTPTKCRFSSKPRLGHLLLPLRWDAMHMGDHCSLSPDALEISATSSRHVSACLADRPLSPTVSAFWELQVFESGPSRDASQPMFVCIGIATRETALEAPLSNSMATWSYMPTGAIFQQGVGTPQYGLQYTAGDVIGCAYNARDRTLSYYHHRDGYVQHRTSLGVAFKNLPVETGLYPAVSVSGSARLRLTPIHASDPPDELLSNM